MFRSKFDRVPAAVVAGGFFLQGVGELIARVDEPMPLLYRLPTLFGGAALMFAGAFLIKGRDRLSKVPIIIGAVLGFSPSAWTVLMPILLIVLFVRTVTAGAQAMAVQ